MSIYAASRCDLDFVINSARIFQECELLCEQERQAFSHCHSLREETNRVILQGWNEDFCENSKQ